MEQLLNRNINEILADGKFKILVINGIKLMVFENGSIYRWLSNGNLRVVNNVNNRDGYNILGCKNKLFARHRIVAYAFLGLDLDNTKIQVDHINNNRIDNCVSNLRLVTNQQNCFNKSQVKGYCWDKVNNKYEASIMLNRKHIKLGRFKTEEEASTAYQSAKLIYHII